MISYGNALLRPPKGHFHFDLAWTRCRHLVRPSRAFNFYDTFSMYSQCAIFIHSYSYSCCCYCALCCYCSFVLLSSFLFPFSLRSVQARKRQSTKVCNYFHHRDTHIHTRREETHIGGVNTRYSRLVAGSEATAQGQHC